MDAQEAHMRRKLCFGIFCSHPFLEQELLNNTWTGQYVCQNCGSEFSKISMWEPIHRFLQQESEGRKQQQPQWQEAILSKD